MTMAEQREMAAPETIGGHALHPTERLKALEAIIEHGLQTFVEVGAALFEIREQRLYREQGFTTFEEYCRKRWQWSKTHANRQIQAAEVAHNLTPIGVIPKNE